MNLSGEKSFSVFPSKSLIAEIEEYVNQLIIEENQVDLFWINGAKMLVKFMLYVNLIDKGSASMKDVEEIISDVEKTKVFIENNCNKIKDYEELKYLNSVESFKNNMRGLQGLCDIIKENIHKDLKENIKEELNENEKIVAEEKEIKEEINENEELDVSIYSQETSSQKIIKIQNYFEKLINKKILAREDFVDPRLRIYLCYGDINDEDIKKILEIYSNKVLKNHNKEVLNFEVGYHSRIWLYKIKDSKREKLMKKHMLEFEKRRNRDRKLGVKY